MSNEDGSSVPQDDDQAIMMERILNQSCRQASVCFIMCAETLPPRCAANVLSSFSYFGGPPPAREEQRRWLHPRSLDIVNLDVTVFHSACHHQQVTVGCWLSLMEGPLPPFASVKGRAIDYASGWPGACFW